MWGASAPGVGKSRHWRESAVALEPVLAIVHELAHRRRGLGGNLHQVQSLFLSDVQTLRRGHNAQLFAVFADEADLLIPDLFIEFMLYLANNRRTSIRSIKKRECIPCIRAAARPP